MKKFFEYILITIGVIIVISLLSRNILFIGNILSKSEVDTVEVVTIKYDTIPAPPADTVMMVDTIYFPQIVYREAPINSGEDSVSVYADSVVIDSLNTVIYRASITGRLNAINFGVIRKYPEQIVKTVAKDRKITETVYTSGIYAGLGIDSRLYPSIEASYVNKRNSIDLSINVRKEVVVAYKFKIL